MSQWEGRSKGNKAGYSIFIWLLSSFGISPAYFLLRFVAFYYFLFSSKSSGHILYFYRERLGFSKLKSLLSLYRNYYHFGQALIDRAAIQSGKKSWYKFDLDEKNTLAQLVKEGKGGILLSAHAGNWEAAAQLLNRSGIKANIVMYDGESESIKKYMQKVKSDKSFNIILIKDDLSHIYKIMEAVNANEFVCMLADRFLPESKTLKTKFLGKAALFPEGPFALALALRAPVVYLFAFKEKARHYRFFASGIRYFDKRKGDIAQTVMDDYTNHLEKIISEYPTQWYNYYDFWQI